MPDRITFINHSTVLIQFGETAILTDPVYSFSISYFLPRLKKPGVSFDALPPLSFVAISHNHYDHLNFRTLRKLARMNQSRIFVPKGDGTYARRTGFSTIHELQWWESIQEGDLKITCVPAKHPSGRTPWNRNKSLACGYVFESGGKAVYFAGDTALGDFFPRLAKQFSLDVALLPIGAYKPYDWFKDIHLNPTSALEAFAVCKAKLMIPIHWGTFKISDEPMNEPPRWLEAEARNGGIAERVKVLENGESIDI